jgi:hypothetical protein
MVCGELLGTYFFDVFWKVLEMEGSCKCLKYIR